MSGFRDCILQNPALSSRQAEALVREYDDLTKRYTATMGDALAAQAAARKYVDIKQKQIQKKAENVVRDVLAWEGISARVDAAADAYRAEKASAVRGTKSLWGRSGTASATRAFLESVYTRQQALERRATLGISELIEKYRSKNAGLTQDVEGFADVVRETLGAKTGKAEASAGGRAIREVFDSLHRMYEQAGGILGKLENYYPQSHNPQLVGRAGFDRWRDSILPLLDRDRMLDPDTGLPFSDKRLEEAMRESYEGIRSNGLNEVVKRAREGKQTFGKGGGVALRHNSSRFFHFKDAEAYLEYNRRFGYGDAGLFGAMMGHVHAMTRDIAIMQEMGPNPAGQIERLKMKIRADGAGPQADRTVQGMYDVLAGRTSYHGELPGWYRSLKGLQNWLRSAYLGSAPVSAMSDSFYAAWTAKMNGLPAGRVLGQYLKILNPASAADRRAARRLGFIAGAASGDSLAQARFADDVGANGITAWLASFTNRASGLAVMTDAVRQSMVMGTQAFMAEARAARTLWKDLPPAMKEAFARNRMTEADFNAIVSSKPHVDPDTEADFIRPEDVALAGHAETATRYENWLVQMAQHASNEPSLFTRAITTGAVFGDAKEGTALRATASSVMMFKSFGVTVMLNHMLPALRHAATAKGLDRLSRVAPILVATTVLGAASLQSKQVVGGKEPRDMNDPKFWKAAALQGGGFGIFSDFLFGDYSRFNQSVAVTLAGPVVGFGNDTLRAFMGNFDRSLDEGTETKFFADLYQLAERNIPGVKLWYTRLVLERLALDQAERMVDPRFDERMRRIEGKMRKDYGQRFWWAPGEALPEAAQQ